MAIRRYDERCDPSMDEAKLELKVGTLVVASLASLVGLLWLMGELSLGRGVPLEVDFAHTGNVVRGAPVKLAGIVVGSVAEVKLVPSRRDGAGQPLPVHMTLELTKEAAASLRADASLTVSTQGPLGEPYLELWPGRAEAAWPTGAALRAIDAPRLDLVSNRLAGFLEAASRVLDKDPEVLSKLVGGVGNVAGTVDGMLTENRADVRETTKALALAAADLRALAALARGQLEPGGKANAALDDAAHLARGLKADVPELSKKASTALGGLAAFAGPLDETDGQHVKVALARFQAASEKLDGMAAKADGLLKRLEAGDGTLGAMLKDKQAYEDFKALLADLRKHPWKMLWKE